MQRYDLRQHSGVVRGKQHEIKVGGGTCFCWTDSIIIAQPCWLWIGLKQLQHLSSAAKRCSNLRCQVGDLSSVAAKHFSCVADSCAAGTRFPAAGPGSVGCSVGAVGVGAVGVGPVGVGPVGVGVAACRRQRAWIRF